MWPDCGYTWCTSDKCSCHSARVMWYSVCCAVRKMLGLKGAQTSALMLPSTLDCLFCQPRGCKLETVGDRKMTKITCLRGKDLDKSTFVGVIQPGVIVVIQISASELLKSCIMIAQIRPRCHCELAFFFFYPASPMHWRLRVVTGAI